MIQPHTGAWIGPEKAKSPVRPQSENSATAATKDSASQLPELDELWPVEPKPPREVELLLEKPVEGACETLGVEL